MLVRPKTAFVVASNGTDLRLAPTDILDDTDPVVRAHPDSFEPLVPTVHTAGRPFEEATATPGEQRRGPGRPRKNF